MTDKPKSWADALLGLAITLAISAWLLSWAWQLIQPLIPVILTMACMVGLVALLIRRHRQW